MAILLNGSPMEFAHPEPVADFLTGLGAPATGVAIAVNGVIVPRSRWSEAMVDDGDTVEVLTAMQGG